MTNKPKLMKKLLLTAAAAAICTAAFAQSESSGLDQEKNEIFRQEHLYQLPEFSKGMVMFDQDAAVYDDNGIPITLHRSQGVINIDNLNQCVMMIADNDTIPLLYENYVTQVTADKYMYLKIKGQYYKVLEYNEIVLAVMEKLNATDMGKKDIYGTSSQLSSTTNISSLSSNGGTLENLTGNTDMRYSFEKRPVFINLSNKKVAYFNEKQLCKIFKKKSAIVKAYFASHDVDTYSQEQAQELYNELMK